jgi:hypothetical protein
MKARLLSILLFPAALLLTGCDEQARKFAEQAKAILDQRSVQLAKKIAAEAKAYEAYAALATENDRTLVNDSLMNERSERADQLGADYADGREPVSHWLSHLAEYAQVDYDRNRELLMGDLDASTLYLQRYEELKIEQDKVDALSKLLSTLAKKQSLKDEMDALTGFAQDTKKEFDKKVCSDLQAKKAAGDVAATKLYDDKKCTDVLK